MKITDFNHVWEAVWIAMCRYEAKENVRLQGSSDFITDITKEVLRSPDLDSVPDRARLLRHPGQPEVGILPDLLREAESRKWCIVPPNQETTDWTVYANFDGEFGYDNEIGAGATMTEALEIAAAATADTEDVR